MSTVASIKILQGILPQQTAKAFRPTHCVLGGCVQGPGDRTDPHADPFLMPSKAQNMVDEMRQAIASLPPHMDAMCRAIAARGGPKVPPGVHTLAQSQMDLYYTVTDIHMHLYICCVLIVEAGGMSVYSTYTTEPSVTNHYAFTAKRFRKNCNSSVWTSRTLSLIDL